MADLEKQINEVRDLLAGARRVMALTGAGVSAESGVPTFRGAAGHWTEKDALRLASPEGFASDPATVWQWYDARRQQIAVCKPNPAHIALAALERQIPDFLLVTQNVDGLHRLAGSRRIAEMHGNIWRVRRTEPPFREWELCEAPLANIPPLDTDGTLLRPGVVWFGEMLSASEIVSVSDFTEDPLDAVLLIGTTAAVTWVPGVALEARQAGAVIVEVNVAPTDLTPFAAHHLAGPAGEILPRIVPPGFG